MNRALLDKDFLKELDECLEKEVYVKIISLDFNENPRAEIQGVATGGSVNVDGSSSVRRTCSLNLVTNNARVNELDWALESKFRLEVGLRNFINSDYEDIIWFPQGLYIITSFGMTANAQGFSISIQGKDKMCLLDGSVGGNFFASHDFGKLEIRYDDGTIEFEPILIYDIIRNVVHEYAFEPYENIIITDLEDCAVELIEHRIQDKDLVIYNIHDYSNHTYETNIAFEGNPVFDKLIGLSPGDKCEEDDKLEVVKWATYGDTIGYRLTDLTYPTSQDLIFGAGASVTQLLDALVQMLGEFEYFYDLNGRFIFQRKKIYYNVSWTNAITTEKETYYDSVENGSANAYHFTKGVLIESYNNKPDLTNIKNDYTIWGNMIAVDGSNLPAHLRCAIDDKPTYYKPLLNNKDDYIYSTSMDLKTDITGTIVPCDWREVIYRMAYDYSKSDAEILKITKEIQQETDVDKLTTLKENLIKWNNTWNTNYISYYTDILDFWRILYNPDNQIQEKDEKGVITLVQNPWTVDNYGWNPDYVECRRHMKYREATQDELNDEDVDLYSYNYNLDKWVKDDNGKYVQYDIDKDEIIIKNHTSIPFWIDFCDDAYLEKYKPANIGRRPKVINDSEVKAIFYEETPNVLFVDPLTTEPYSDSKLSYIRLNLPAGMADYFQISTQGKSAKESLDNLLYNHTYYCESITLSCIPIYYLEPNVRISVYDETSGINGEYIIKSYNLQLAYNGSMSITATKAEDLIL